MPFAATGARACGCDVHSRCVHHFGVFRANDHVHPIRVALRLRCKGREERIAAVNRHPDAADLGRAPAIEVVPGGSPTSGPALSEPAGPARISAMCCQDGEDESTMRHGKSGNPHSHKQAEMAEKDVVDRQDSAVSENCRQCLGPVSAPAGSSGCQLQCGWRQGRRCSDWPPQAPTLSGSLAADLIVQIPAPFRPAADGVSV